MLVIIYQRKRDEKEKRKVREDEGRITKQTYHKPKKKKKKNLNPIPL